MCGPSNAAKGLSNHLDNDRSLQQDRFTSASRAPSQGFRTRPANGSADGEQSFHNWATSSSRLNLPGYSQQPLTPPVHNTYVEYMSNRSQSANNVTSNQNHVMNHGVGRVSSGAAAIGASTLVQDFNQMRLNGGFTRATQNSSFTPMGLNGSFSAAVPHRHAGQMHQPAPASSMRYTTGMALAPLYFEPPASSLHIPGERILSTSPQNNVNEDFDFDSELQSWMAHQGVQAETREEPSAAVRDNGLEEPNMAPPEYRSSINHQEQEAAPVATEASAQQTNDSELAVAAQKILDSVSGNQNEKFKSSEFLNMMRKLASMEIVVRDNSLVETSQQSQEGVAASSRAARGPQRGPAGQVPLASSRAHPTVPVQSVMPE